MQWTPQVGDTVVIRIDHEKAVTGRIEGDFGVLPSVEVSEIGVRPPRRWAVATDDGGLIFADTEDLRPDEAD